MKNIPVFMSPAGTATLILQEIPRSGRAFILLQTIVPEGLQQLTADAKKFCQDCGAKEIFISNAREKLPFSPAYDILILTVQKDSLPAGRPVTLQPLSQENAELYISIYNRCFEGISHAVSYDRSQIRRIKAQDQQAFIACSADGSPAGIGELHGNELAAVAVLPEYRGMGKALTLSLLALCPGPEIILTVASDNQRALGLYEKLEFHVKEIESRWYHCP